LLGTLDLPSGLEGMAVNPNGALVYLSGGSGPGLPLVLIRVNASNPQAMTQVSLANGGGIGVDSTTGRYATTNGYGDMLLVYNSDDTLYDSRAITGCYGGFDADPATGRFFVVTQCSDSVIVYSETSRSLLLTDALNGVGSGVAFDRSTGNLFAVRGNGANYQTLVLSPTYAMGTPVTGYVYGANPVTGKLYVLSNPPSSVIQVLSDSTYAVLDTVPVSPQHLEIDTARDRFYVINGGSVLVYDGASDALLTTVTLPGGFTAHTMKMAIGDSRLYVLGTNGTMSELFVFAT
jgi:hypothetical protein